MKKFTIWAFAAMVAMVSCSKEESPNGDYQLGESITIGLSDGNVSYSPLAVKSVESGDLVAVQIYTVSSSVATPYAYGLFTDFNGLTFEGISGMTYKVVASMVKSAESVIYCNGDVYGKPFNTSVAEEFTYSETALANIALSAATLSDGVEYSVPNVDRYHAEASKAVTATDAKISLFMKRIAFGIQANIDDSVSEDITIEVAGAPSVTKAYDDSSDYIIYTHSDLAAAYSADESSVTYSEDLNVVVTSNATTIYEGNVTFYRNMCAILNCSAAGDFTFNVEFEDAFEQNYSIITFEGDEWNALVPASQSSYTEPLYSNTQYTWSDTATGLSGNVNENGWKYYDTDLAYAFWSGGSIVSNYDDGIENADSNVQLAVPIGGYNGSDNFVVVYSDQSTVYYGGEKAALTFDNGARTIDHLYLANTSYMLNSATNGDGYYVPTGGIVSGDYYTVTFTGYDADNNETDSVVAYMAYDGVCEMSWKKVSLLELGAVSKITVLCDSNVISSGTNAIPGYVAIDNIAVVK